MGASCYTQTETLDGQAISCAFGRSPLAPAWGQLAYYVANGYTPPASPPVTTPIDVTRFWCQAIQDHGMTFADITSVYNGSTPGGWGTIPDIAGELVPTYMTQGEFDALNDRHLQ